MKTLGLTKSVHFQSIFGAKNVKTLTLRLDDEDHKLFTLLADADDLPVATFIRRVLRQLAREKGLLATAQPTNNPAAQSTTTTPPTAPMRDGVQSREALLKRIEAGEQLRDVAASAGIQVSELQARVSKAKIARTDGSLDKAMALEAFLRDTPKPDDGKEYVPAYFGGVYEWKETRPAFDLPTPVDEALARAPHEHSDDPEENAARVRAKLAAMGFYV